MKTFPFCLVVSVVAMASFAISFDSSAQPAATSTNAPPARTRPVRPAPVQVSSDGHITFRIMATNAQNVRVSAGDIPGAGGGLALTKTTNNIWEGTVGSVQPGEYRYNFNVDGVSVVAPRNPGTDETSTISESNDEIWSLVNVPGSALFDMRNVPHGAVETVTYFSKALDRNRRMHVYTPPGYEKGKGRYPVFYLLHGSGDSDDAWSTVGRAGFIFDNLIADGKVKPMVVVMPAGHTSTPRGRGVSPSTAPTRDEFQEDFLGDVMPYAESHYRVYSDQKYRAIAGLSMGGSQTMNAAFATLDKFAYIGVFSSGTGLSGPAGGTNVWEESHKAVLNNPKLKKNVKLIWLSTGKGDGLVTRSRATVEMLKKHGFNPVYIESTGAHTWINWRDYLGEFAPQLFR